MGPSNRNGPRSVAFWCCTQCRDGSPATKAPMMWKHLRTQREKCSGFTLIEALIAVALMGVILAALTSITSQWLPSWNRGIARAQRSEIVRIAAIPNKGEPVLVRATKPFAPLAPNTTLVPGSDFANPVVLLRSPYLVSFAYAGRDRIWKTTWQNAEQLPAAVRLTVRDATSGRTLTISTTALVHVELPAVCAGPKSKDDCANGQGQQPENAPGLPNPDKQRT